MRRVPNDALARRVLKHLCDTYNLMEIREPNHLSTYVYCITRGFLDQRVPADPTDTELMLFALGYGLQDVLTPKDTTAPIINKDGVIYRPDFILSARQNEIKTTRKSSKNHEEVPETWLNYMKGGCKMLGTDEYDLIVLYLMGNYGPPFPQILADTFYFSQQEIDDTWNWLMARKVILDKALEANLMPQPFKYSIEWECKYCRYSIVCQQMERLGQVLIMEEDDKNE